MKASLQSTQTLPAIAGAMAAIVAAAMCFLSADAIADEPPDQPPVSNANVISRGHFRNAKLRFEKDKVGHVAFMGGSITEMNGYRPMVMETLTRRFPDTEFTFTDAGISSTCSTTGAFRLQDHVLSHGPVDLFFVEFAVNDDQDAGHAHREALRGMEGIVRHTRLHNPRSDIVLTYFVNPGMLKLYQEGKTPLSVAAHEEVAEHYQIPAINLARQTAESISDGKLTWELFGGTHPKPFGNRIATRMIEQLMERSWAEDSATDIADHPLPDSIDPAAYSRGRLIDPALATRGQHATVKIPVWKELDGGFRDRFADRNLLCLEGEGATAELEFEGTAVGAYVLAGPDAGIVEASIDGSDFTPVDLYHRFSAGLHYPRTVMFDADLPTGQHKLSLRVSGDTSSKGKVARILYFVAN